MQVAGQAEPYAFSFFSDIFNHPSVSEAALRVLDTIKAGMGALVRHLGEWHAEYKSLWGMKRVNENVWCVLYLCVVCFVCVCVCVHVCVCVCVCLYECVYMYE